MELGNSSVRDKLLGRLPQPENLAAYREETVSLLAKHERALFWYKRIPIGAAILGIGLVELLHQRGVDLVRTPDELLLGILVCILLLVLLSKVRYLIYQSKVDILKEVKQVQLQVLELQASLQKTGDRHC